VTPAPDPVPDDIEALRAALLRERAALLAEQLARREAVARASGAEAMVAHLKLLMWTALGRQRLSALSQHSRFPSQTLCFVHGLLLGVGRGSGQLRPYVRPVARRVPLAIMGVRSRVRHQSDWRAQGGLNWSSQHVLFAPIAGAGPASRQVFSSQESCEAWH
jgi:hypothetical protein